MSQQTINKSIDQITTNGLPALYRYQGNTSFAATLAILGAAGLGLADKLENPEYDFSLVETIADWKRVLLCNLGLYRQMFMNSGYLECEWKSAVRHGRLLEIQLYEHNNSKGGSLARQMPMNLSQSKIIVATESFGAIADRAQHVITLLHINVSTSLKLFGALSFKDSKSCASERIKITKGLRLLQDSFEQGSIFKEAALIRLMGQVRKL